MKDSFSTPCLCESARRLSRRLTAIYDERLGRVGLNASQCIVLRRVSSLAPVAVSSLAAAVELEQSTMTRNLAALKQLGLVDIAVGKSDGRTKVVSLTRSGKALLKKVDVAWEEAQQAASEILSPALKKLLLTS